MDQQSSTESAAKFVRDRVTWLSYLMIATYCYAAAALGPLMTFLRAELQLNYTISALHFGFWSGGIATAGITGDRCMKRFGRRNTVWIATLFLCLGLFVLIGGRHPAVTIAGAYLCGLSGSTMAQTMSTILSDRYLALRAVAITESTIVASICCSLSPVAIAFFSKTELGWRTAMLVPPLAFLVYFLTMRSTLSDLHLAEAESKSKQEPESRLPKEYWLCWSLVYFSVAGEWSIMFWTAEYLESVINLPRADAAACVTSFLFAMVVGRIIGSRLARRVNAVILLRVASLAAIFGFIMFWSSKVVLICLLGLFITGLGVSNFYPLTLAQAVASAPGKTSQATSRMSLASGGATLTAPLLLGLIAEKFGILSAYGLIALLMILCSIIVFLPVWTQKRQSLESLPE